jgi:hypothetical protein
MEKEIILFDWDDTLFSKTEYKKNLRGNLARICEVTEEEIFGFEEKYFESLIKSDDFQINDFLQKFSQRFNKDIQLEDFNSDKLGIYSGALFPDTISTLEALIENYRLGIYSQGFDSLQRIKIRSSGIESFFDKELIYVNRNKLDLEFLATLPDGATIVDDKKEVIEKLHPLKKFKLFWLNRVNNDKFPGVKTIKSLLEITE